MYIIEVYLHHLKNNINDAHNKKRFLFRNGCFIKTERKGRLYSARAKENAKKRKQEI